MNPNPLAMLVGARVTLLVGAIVLFLLGLKTPPGISNLLFIAAFIAAILYFYLHVRTRRIVKRLTKETNETKGDDAR